LTDAAGARTALQGDKKRLKIKMSFGWVCVIRIFNDLGDQAARDKTTVLAKIKRGE
jgi:hypothetical protein